MVRKEWNQFHRGALRDFKLFAYAMNRTTELTVVIGTISANR